MHKFLKKSFIVWVVVSFVRLYQFTVSPDHGFLRVLYPNGCCRYYPSCSQYAADSIRRYGIILGILKAVWRVVRCNPWAHPRVDEV